MISTLYMHYDTIRYYGDYLGANVAPEYWSALIINGHYGGAGKS